MKILTFLAILIITSCSKSKSDDVANKNYTVKAVVWNEKKTSGSAQEYWKPGVLFDKAIKTKGTAVVSWTFPAGWINGNPSGKYSQTLNINIDGSKNSYFEFSNWQVDYTIQAQNIKIESIDIDGGYELTRKN
jgi:outer membrane biogenesis lipoprotein LolB